MSLQPRTAARSAPAGRLYRAMIGAAVAVTMAGGAGAPAAAQSAGTIPPPPFGLESPAGSCVVCHSLEAGGPFRVAPNLWSIVGAEKARDREWYGYSMALRTKGGVWTEEELDAFLKDAGTFAPGSTKSIRLADATQRQAVVDYLKTLK
jgi:cytochrome c2